MARGERSKHGVDPPPTLWNGEECTNVQGHQILLDVIACEARQCQVDARPYPFRHREEQSDVAISFPQ